jgi:hypothetical protein
MIHLLPGQRLQGENLHLLCYS